MPYIYPNGSVLTCSVVGCLQPAEHRVSDFYYCDAHLPANAPVTDETYYCGLYFPVSPNVRAQVLGVTDDARPSAPVGPWQLAGIPTPPRVTRERVPALIDEMDVILSILIGEAMLS